MTPKQIRDAVSSDEFLSAMLLSDHGTWVCITEDSEVVTSDSGSTIPPSAAIALRAPGVGNLDSFCEGFVTYDENRDAYVVSGDFHDDIGRVVGDLKDVIAECIHTGDMSRWIDDYTMFAKDSYRELSR